jgi:hypothetical protein
MNIYTKMLDNLSLCLVKDRKMAFKPHMLQKSNDGHPVVYDI